MQRKIKHGYTVDAVYSKDLDDGFLLIEKDDSYVLEVSIADVSSMVNLKKNKELYDNAFKQVETLYYAKSNDPMLPRYLSEDRLSLLPGAPRPTITFTITLSKNDLEVIDFKIERSSFRSKGKCNYENIDKIIKEGVAGNKFKKMFLLADVLAQRLLLKRRDAGALAIYDLNHGWYTNEEGQMVKILKENAYRSHVIIQEFMILTNHLVSEHLVKNNIPFILRNHTARTSAIPREKLLEQLAYLAVNPSQNQIQMMQKKLNLTMNRANYGTKLYGHYGLNLPVYSHWTSPIRRFADLVNHIILNCFLDGKPSPPFREIELSVICDHINEVKNRYRDERKEYFQLENIAKNGGLVGGEPLLDRKFPKILKQISQTTDVASPEILEKIHTKIVRGALDQREFFLIFFDQKFALENIRMEAFLSITQSKHLTMVIFKIAEDKKLVKNLSFKIERKDSKFTCIAELKYSGINFVSKETIPTNQKEARHIACLDILGQILESWSKGFLEKANDKLKSIPEVSKVPPLPKVDYVSALYAMCNILDAKVELEFPEQNDMQTFVCVAKFIQGEKVFSAESEISTKKKDAKNMAAMLLLQELKKVEIL